VEKKIEIPSQLFDELICMVEVFTGCIEIKALPLFKSPCHLKAQELVDRSNKERFKTDEQQQS